MNSKGQGHFYFIHIYILITWQVVHDKTRDDATAHFTIDTIPTPREGTEYISPDDRLALDGVSLGNKLSPDDLSKLEKSEELKQLLTNPHLRDYLSYVNSLDYPKGFMKIAMQEPIFVEFADACMKVIHPENYQPKELSDEQIVGKLQEKLIERAEDQMNS